MTAHTANNHLALLTLLDDLRTSAQQPLDSLSAWAKVLANRVSTPPAVEFLTQLGAEWYRAPAPNTLCASVAAEVREHLYTHGIRGVHLWTHVQRVMGTALALAEESGDDPVLAYLTAILHDTTKLDGGADAIPHQESGAAFAGDVLHGDLPFTAISRIQAAIRKDSHESLGDILYDADHLDKIGATGIVRRSAEYANGDDPREALARIERDLDAFPAMNFDASRTLARHKRVFLHEFLPLAFMALNARG